LKKSTTVKNAFAQCDEILRQAVEGISDLITTPGLINIDFADIRAVMENSGSALMGIGSATGENRAVDAAKMAINSPLLDVSITGAKGVLFSIAGGEDLTMFEIQDAAKIITESIDPQAKVIFGTVRDDKLKKNEVKVTVIAAGFPDTSEVAGKLFGGSSSTGRTSALAGGAVGGIEPTIGALTREIRESRERDGKESAVVTGREERSRGRIFNSLSSVLNSPADKAVKESKDIKDEKEKKADDDDDWGAVPAFLRRSKIK